MRSETNPFTRKFSTKTLWILAGVGLLLFFLLQLIIPSISQEQVQQSMQVISKEQAQKAAVQFAKSELKMDVSQENIKVLYNSRSDVYGYLSKNKVLEQYNKSYDKQFPTELFQVQILTPEADYDYLNINVHMVTGKVTGFEQKKYSMITFEGQKALSLQKKVNLAKPYLDLFGFNQDELEIADHKIEVLTYELPGYTIKDAHAKLKFNYSEDSLISAIPYFEVPEGHTDFVESQTNWALWLTYAGSGLFTFILGILAIIYSALTRSYTTYKRGIALAIIYFILYCIMVVNAIPTMQLNPYSDQGIMVFTIVLQIVIYLFTSAFLYFSLVAGDGLWRKQGLPLWPRSREKGYGRHVMSSVWDGYAWAFILLGAQAVIFFILERSIHTWSTTQAESSPYNLLSPLLFPLTAWVAGIGEEAVYRLFGIPMLKKMFRSTFVACVITSLIWALGHTLYPVYPIYSRPIELLFIGLMFSFVFLRYGFITAVFAHVIFDSILMSFALAFMGGTVNVVAALFYIVLPAIVGYVIYVFNPESRERSRPPHIERNANKEEEPQFTTPHPEGQQ